MKNKELKITADGNRDGALRMENARTLETYRKIKREMTEKVTPSDYGCFFAFTTKQYEEGLKKTGNEGKRIVRTQISGMYGTEDGVKEYLKQKRKQISECHKKIRENCDPQEVYAEEYNNYECCYTDDTEAMKEIMEIWGGKTAGEIRRHNAALTVRQIRKEMDHPTESIEEMDIEEKKGEFYTREGEKIHHLWFGYEDERNGDKEGVLFARITFGIAYIKNKKGEKIVMKDKAGETWEIIDKKTIRYMYKE